MVAADRDLRIYLTVTIIGTVKDQNIADGSRISALSPFAGRAVLVKRFVADRRDHFGPHRGFARFRPTFRFAFRRVLRSQPQWSKEQQTENCAGSYSFALHEIDWVLPVKFRGVSKSHSLNGPSLEQNHLRPERKLAANLRLIHIHRGEIESSTRWKQYVGKNLLAKHQFNKVYVFDCRYR